MIDSKPLTPNVKTVAPAPATPVPATKAITPKPVEKKTEPALQYKKSTIKEQEREPWSKKYSPLQIRFLTGAYKDQLLDTGFNVKELTTAQTAEWEKGKSSSIRVGHNFVSISPRTFNITLEYWSLNDDVQQLVENNAHLHEITDASVTPPKLQITFGTATIDPLICTSLSFKYDSPLPDNKGMRHGTADLTFELNAGVGTKHQLAPPLAPTPLRDFKESITRAERERQGTLNSAKRKLAECLSEDSNKQISDVLDNNKLGDESAIASLNSDAFINLAIAGSIPKEILERPAIQEKLRQDLAQQLAVNESGITPGVSPQLKEAILSGDGSLLPTTFTDVQTITVQGKDGVLTTKSQSEFEQLSGDYQKILTSISEQKLDSSSTIFNTDSGVTATERFNKIGACGYTLRSSGAPKVKDVQGSSQVTLSGINHAISLAKDDEEIKKLFGLPEKTPETIIRKIRNGQPYKSKEDFFRDASYGQGITAASLWSSFDQNETATLSGINTEITKEGVSDDDLKKKFGIDDKQLAGLKNKGKPFASKEEFLKAIQPVDSLEGKGNEVWRNFQIN
jgi:hypothetical protein